MKNNIVDKRLVLKAEDIVTIGGKLFANRGDNKKRFMSGDGFYSEGCMAIKEKLIEEWDNEFVTANKINGWVIDKKLETNKIKDIEEKGNLIKVIDSDGFVALFNAKFYRFLKANLADASIEINSKEMALYFKDGKKVLGMMLGLRFADSQVLEKTFEEDVTIEELLNDEETLKEEENRATSRLDNFIEEKSDEMLNKVVEDIKEKRNNSLDGITVDKAIEEDENVCLIACADGEKILEKNIKSLGYMDSTTAEKIASKTLEKMENINIGKNHERPKNKPNDLTSEEINILELLNDPDKSNEEKYRTWETYIYLEKIRIEYYRIKNKLERKKSVVTITSEGDTVILSKQELVNLALFNNYRKRKDIIDEIDKFTNMINKKTFFEQGLTRDEVYSNLLNLVELLISRKKNDDFDDDEILTKRAYNGFKKLLRFDYEDKGLKDILEGVYLGVIDYKLIK